MRIYMGDTEWCPTALADIASATTLFNLGIATTLDPYDSHQKFFQLNVDDKMVFISRLPAFGLLIGEEQLEQKVTCISSMTALKESMTGAATHKMDFH